MKTFLAAFTAQKNLLAGASPVWIFTFSAGGVTYYLSDNATPVAPWGITTKKWVKTWGQLQEGISGTLDEYRIADFNLDILIDPDANPTMEDLATTYELEESTCSLYLWFYGCTDPPQEMIRGYVKDLTIPNETVVQLTIQDESIRLQNATIGNLVTLDLYPDADPDDVGKVIPIVYGSVSKLPALAVSAGVQTSIPAGVSATAAAFTISETTGLQAGMAVQIDVEQMLIGAVDHTASTLTVTRGVNGTIAATHQAGAVVWQLRDAFYYLLADHPVDAIPKAYAKVGQALIDISPACTVWPAGDCPAYPGKAVLAVSEVITIQQAVSLALLDGITVDNGTLQAALGGALAQTGTVSLSGSPAKTGTAALTGSVTKTGSATLTGSPDKTGTAALTGSPAKTGTAALTGSVSKTGSATLTGSPDKTGTAALTGSPAKTGTAALTGSPAKTGTASLTGSPAKTGTATLSGTLGFGGSPTLTGNVALSGLVSLLGSLTDPGHTHNTGQSSTENTTTGLPTPQPAMTAVSFASGFAGIGWATNGLYLQWPTDGARSSVTYNITFLLTQNVYPLRFWVVVNNTVYCDYLNAVALNVPFSFSFTVSGNISVDTVYILTIQNICDSHQWKITSASRTIMLTSLVSSASTANLTNNLSASNGTLAAGNGTLATTSGTLSVTNGTLAVSDSSGVSAGTLAVSDGIAIGTGTLAVNDGIAVGTGTLAVTDGITVGTGTLAVSDGIGVSDTLAVSDGIGVDAGTLAVSSTQQTALGTLGASLIGNVAKTGTVTLSGNSVANTLVGDGMFADVVNNITAPADVFSDFLANRCGYSSFQSIGTWPASSGFNGAITESKTALYWLNYLAFQARAWFRLDRGVAQLIYRPDTVTPVKTIASCRITGGKKVYSRSKTLTTEILNTVNVLFARDWTQGQSATAYRAVASGSDAGSIATYGACEKADLFQFDFVTDPDMARDLLAFYLGFYKNRHWFHQFDDFLYDAELEFADGVTLGFNGGLVGQVLQTKLTPGNSTTSDTIGMVVIV